MWRSAQDQAWAAGLQPALGKGHQLRRFRRGKGALKTEDPVVGAGTVSAGDGDAGFEGAGRGRMAHGGDKKLADGHGGPLR